jgi:hypothetical protein
MLCRFFRPGFLVLSLIVTLTFVNGCSVEASKAQTSSEPLAAKTVEPAVQPAPKAASIKIVPNSPADTVRVFYKNLREGKVREAILLTNLRPAIEGLTDSELREFQVDFEAIGKHVPSEIEINGEIISGNNATVTAKLPNEDFDKTDFQQLRLRKDADVWVILTVDESAEKRIRQEGKRYFFNLRMETHEDEARDMLNRVAKAQMAYAAQNQGLYGEVPALIEAGFLPDDIRTSQSTGYNFAVTVSSDRKSYAASAVPAVYGKTGKRSFTVELDHDGQPHLASRDAGAPKGK